MKKRTIAVVILSLLMLFTGCQPKDATATRVGSNILLDQGCDSNLFYSDEKLFLMSIEEERRTISVGPATSSKALFLYDIETDSIERIVGLSGSCQVPSALPYKDGFVYVSYIETDIGYEWQIVEVTDDSKKILLKGNISDYFAFPKLAYTDDKVVALWKDDVKKISALSVFDEDGGFRNIIEEKADWLISTDISNNSREICFYIVEDGVAKLAIANETGIIEKVSLDGKMISFCITRNNVVCVLSDYEDKGIYHLMNYNTNTGDYVSEPLSEVLYSLSGSDGDLIVAYDVNFRLYCIRSKDNKIKPVRNPLGTAFSPANYDRVIGNKIVIHFRGDKIESYYLFNLNP